MDRNSRQWTGGQSPGQKALCKWRSENRRKKILRSQVEGVGEDGQIHGSPTSISRGSCNRILFSSQKLEKDFLRGGLSLIRLALGQRGFSQTQVQYNPPPLSSPLDRVWCGWDPADVGLCDEGEMQDKSSHTRSCWRLGQDWIGCGDGIDPDMPILTCLQDVQTNLCIWPLRASQDRCELRIESFEVMTFWIFVHTQGRKNIAQRDSE